MGHHLVKKGFLIPNFKAKMSSTNKARLKKSCSGLFLWNRTWGFCWYWPVGPFRVHEFKAKSMQLSICSVFSYSFFVSHSVVLSQEKMRLQRCNLGEIFGATSAMLGRICPPPGWNRIKVSENLCATAVTPVFPVVTSLGCKKTLQILAYINLALLFVNWLAFSLD